MHDGFTVKKTLQCSLYWVDNQFGRPTDHKTFRKNTRSGSGLPEDVAYEYYKSLLKIFGK